MSTLVTKKIVLPLADQINGVAGSSDCVHLFWLGQAGFALKYLDTLIVIDPYLSDYLADKYKNALLKHRRMMPSPISPEDAAVADWVLCTHRHSDHFDPWTLKKMVTANPNLKIILPETIMGHAASMGVTPNRCVPINAGKAFSINDDILIEAVPSAHETLETDGEGRHLYLGYLMHFKGLTIYHSGDCTPYSDLCSTLAKTTIDLALLPVNGRDAFRQKMNIPGNFTVQEALNLCEGAGIPKMIGHHYGMFDFNTIDPKAADKAIRANEYIDSGGCARLNYMYELKK